MIIQSEGRRFPSALIYWEKAQEHWFLSLFGPSDRDRTCGLMVPNHPRSQLRHTRIYWIFSARFWGNFLNCGINCGQNDFWPIFWFLQTPETRMNTGVLRLFIFQDIKRPTRSQNWRATNCATPRKLLNFCFYSTLCRFVPKAGATLAVPKIVCSLFTSHNFDRCANKRSLHRPPDAVACVAPGTRRPWIKIHRK